MTMEHESLQPLALSDGRIGLQNLGNTCYMNSALQCLLHIPELNYYFLSDYYKKELNRDNPLGNNGKMAEIFALLIHHLFNLKRSHQTTFAPREFKQTIGRFNSMFSSYHQQDSQEFLSYLLDGLHEDLNRIVKKPYTEKPELTNTESADELQIRELALKSWETHKLRNDSIINDLFVGLYKSTLICPECRKISITFDPYNALTLPLPSEKYWYHKVLILPEIGYPKSFEVEIPKMATFTDLKNYMSEKLSIPVSELICMEVFHSQFFKNYESKDPDINYMPIDSLIQKDDIIIFYQLKHCAGDLVVPVFNTLASPTRSEVKPFGIPFFITLSEEDRLSFGTIREKLEKRYDQLSTYNYFTQVRSKQKNPHTAKDFPLLETVLSQEDSDQMEDDEDDENNGYESDISLANPDIPGDYAFNIRLLDSSNDSKPRVNYSLSSYTPDDSDDDDELWVPKAYGNFKNLHSLLDKLPERKRKYYTYKGNTFDDSPEGQGNDNSTANIEEEYNGFNDSLSNMDNSADEEDLDMEQIHIKSLMDSETPSRSDTISSTPEKDESAMETMSSETKESEEIFGGPPFLVGEKVALVCEWQNEPFDAFFTGMDEEGGKETWESPGEIPNTELIEKRQREQQESKDAKNITLYDCLKLFEQPEVLSDQDQWYCPSCKKHTNATKTLEVWSTPDILTVHLKRFQSQRTLSDKIDAVVDFPINGLDVAPYVVGDESDGSVYDLFAVDNHYGGLGGGHYTAFVKNFVDGLWYYFDDSRVHTRDPEDSIAGSAYLLFYRRRKESGVVGNDQLKEIIVAEQERQKEQVAMDHERIVKVRQLHEEKLKKLQEEKIELQKKLADTDEDSTTATEETVLSQEEYESSKASSLESSSNSNNSTSILPFSNTAKPPSGTSSSSLQLPQVQSLQSMNEVALSSNPPLRKKRKGNVSSPILSPLVPLEDDLINGDSDAESLKDCFSPGLVPVGISNRVYQSSGLVDSPVSTFGNEEDEDVDIDENLEQ